MTNKIPFSVLKEDYDKAEGSFDTDNCAFFHAFKRQFPSLEVQRVGHLSANGENFVAWLEKPFDRGEFYRVARGEEFHTHISITKREYEI